MISRFRLLPEAASTIAGSVDQLYWFIAAISAGFSFAVAGMILFFVIRYRRRETGREHPESDGVLSLEILWSGIPFLISMVMFVWGAVVFLEMRTPPADSMQIFAVGKRWMWKVQHLEGRREINELHIPVGRPVKITMTSEDVIHSFFVPAFRVKQDAVPGRYSEFWFEATKTGEYHLFCSEFCGTQHARMIGKVVVMEPADYQAWLGSTERGGSRLSMAEAGEEAFVELGCASCHGEGDGSRGPSLRGLAGSQIRMPDGTMRVADATYLRQSILQPLAVVRDGWDPVMPSFQGQLTEDRVLELIAYINSLESGDAAAGVSPVAEAIEENEETPWM
ncbi:MAG: cytochrome c oxidase subunit II [Candidatus Binatia bacterium]|jgi:cytochrome c oxidase subunit 2|nr:cytochrome c oxidase subunit II [Candidatus Binatia bacterium]